MREWSERHIRELIKDEYKRLGGGGDCSKYDDLREVIRNYVNYTLMRDSIEALLNGYRVSKIGVDGLQLSDYRIDLTFLIESADIELCYVPILTQAQRAQVSASLTTSELSHYDDITNRYFYKANLAGYFQHNFLGQTTLPAFYEMPAVTVQTNSSSGYYTVIGSANYDLPYINDGDDWEGLDFQFGVRPIPIALPLDAILPTKNPLNNQDVYNNGRIVRRYLTDKNNSSRHLLFERGSINTGYYAENYSISWLDGRSYHDYANKKLEFEYETFIGRQVDYAIYKKVADILGF